jgi:urease accessory protein
MRRMDKATEECRRFEGQPNGHFLSEPTQPLSEGIEQNGFPASEAASQWLLWQLADSAFPTGGFAHSGGLEAAFQQGELRSMAELSAFIEVCLSQLGHASLPFMTSAHKEPAALVELDYLCDSFTTNHVANRASRLQGRAMLASAERIFATVQLQMVAHSGSERLAFCHLAPTFGAIMRALGVGRTPASRLFFFVHTRGLLSSAVRLGIVGPLQAQALQNRLAPHVEKILMRSRNVSVDEIAQTAPLLDLWQGNQDRLYSRLFQS